MSELFFDERQLPKIKNEYVAFVDIMGTQTHMKKSVKETANFIFKLHSAIIAAYREKPYKNVFIYPVMDGAYITSGKIDDMKNILIRIYRSLAELFVEEEKLSYLYLIRGAVAYGEVIHGHNIPYSASRAFEMNLGYKENLLLGNAMISAYIGESKTAPFGIFLDDSAVKHKEKGFGSFSADWKWFEDNELKIKPELSQKLSIKIEEYLVSLEDTNHPLTYKVDRIKEHKKLTKDYFSVKS